MFFLNVLVSYITSCEMPPYTLYFVSIELFILVFLIYESYMLNTLCHFLEKKTETAVAFLLFVWYPYHSLEVVAINWGRRKKKGSRFEYCIITNT